MAKFLSIISGIRTLVSAISSTTGAPDANKIIETNASGFIDASFFPPSIGQSTKTATASEPLGAGDLVNFHGTNQVRKASAASTTNYPAQGFVLSSVTLNGTATVYRIGVNTSVTGLTQGATYYLSATTAGAITTTAPSASGQLIQSVGYADSTSSLTFEYDEPTFIQ